MAIKNRIETAAENVTQFFRDLADALPSARGNLTSDEERKAFSKYDEEDQIAYLLDALPSHVTSRISKKYPENWKKFSTRDMPWKCRNLKPFFKKMDLASIITAAQSLDSMAADTDSPKTAARAQWFKKHFEQPFESKFKLQFDSALSDSDSISYKRQSGTQADGKAIVDWLTSKFRAKFKSGSTSQAAPFMMVSERVKLEDQYAYFVVKALARGGVSVACRF